MIRIRYHHEHGHLVSKPIVAGHELVTVQLNPTILAFQIVNADNKTLHEGTSVSEQMLKIDAKKKLKELGAVFNDETRKHL